MVDASLFSASGELTGARAQDERRKFAGVAPTLVEEDLDKAQIVTGNKRSW